MRRPNGQWSSSPLPQHQAAQAHPAKELIEVSSNNCHQIYPTYTENPQPILPENHCWSDQRSRGLSWSPSNYEELGWKRYFLMSEWDQNRTRASVAIDINARLYSVAIMYPLWLPHSHNMTDFCAFLTYFYHLSHTAVTVIIQTGPSRVPNLPHI